MRIKIEGREYPVVGHRGANVLHLIELREHTRAMFSEPLGMARLDELETQAKVSRRRLRAAQAAGDVDEVRRLQAEQADDGLLGMAIIIFLTRRKAGERVTFAQSIDVDIADVEWIEDPDDAAVVPPDGDDDEDDVEPGTAPDPTEPGPASPGTPDGGPGPSSGAKVKGSGKAGRRGRSTT